MADRYIDTTYIRGHIGTGVHGAITGLTGIVDNTKIEAATALIQAYMRNSGYSPVSTTDPDDVEEIFKLATFGAYYELLASTPEKKINLPDNWESHPAKVAYVGIVSGDIKPDEDPSQAGAVGGAIFTSADEDVEGSRPPKATPEEMSGY